MSCNVSRPIPKTARAEGHRSKAVPPAWIEPQLCQLVEAAPSGPRWVHESKLDGYRIMARIDRGKVQLLTRSGLDWSHKYPHVVDTLAKLPVNSAYIDGEYAESGKMGSQASREPRQPATGRAASR